MILPNDELPPTCQPPSREKGAILVVHPAYGKMARSEQEFTLAEAHLVASGVRLLMPVVEISWHPNHVDVPVQL